MCTPFGATNTLNAISLITDTVSGFSSLKANNDYRTQVAINNAKTSQNEALRQKQLGIEKARLERIEGLNEVSKQKAINAASNMDLASTSNQLGYEDLNSKANLNANLVKKEYDTNANSYFKQANSYLNQASSYARDYNNSLLNLSMNALGQAKKVSDDWYDNIEKEQERRRENGYF